MVERQKQDRRSAQYTRRKFLASGSAAIVAQSVDVARADRVTMRFLQEWGKKGKGPGQLDAPIGLAIDGKDEVLVTEFRNNRVQRFSAEGRSLGSFDVEPMPGWTAVDRQGRIYVAPMMRHKVCVYSPDGRLIREWGSHGKGDGQFDQPGGIAVAPDGTIYVADQVNRRVQRFSPEGRFLLKWGEYGTRPGQFDGREKLPNRTGGPNFVAVDSRGYVYTTEAAPGRIQKFTSEGRPVAWFGDNGTGPGGFGGRPRNLPGPIAICVEDRGRIWVSSTNHRIQAFSPDGKFLGGAIATEPGDGPGRFHTPHGLAFDGHGHLYVADSQNHRIQKFSV
jgi:sugar lactone lactonase YvrE